MVAPPSRLDFQSLWPPALLWEFPESHQLWGCGFSLEQPFVLVDYANKLSPTLISVTVNDLINAFSLMNASYLINVPLSWQVCIERPSLTNAPCLINGPPSLKLEFRHRRGPRWKYHGARWGFGCRNRAIRTTTTLFCHFVCTIYCYGFVDGLDLSAHVLDSLLKLCHLDYYNTIFRIPCYSY